MFTNAVYTLDATYHMKWQNSSHQTTWSYHHLNTGVPISTSFQETGFEGGESTAI
jgi:hypothetical protein